MFVLCLGMCTWMQVSMDTRRSHWIPWNCYCRQLWAVCCMLGTELWFCAEHYRALSHLYSPVNGCFWVLAAGVCESTYFFWGPSDSTQVVLLGLIRGDTWTSDCDCAFLCFVGVECISCLCVLRSSCCQVFLVEQRLGIWMYLKSEET